MVLLSAHKLCVFFLSTLVVLSHQLGLNLSLKPVKPLSCLLWWLYWAESSMVKQGLVTNPVLTASFALALPGQPLTTILTTPQQSSGSGWRMCSTCTTTWSGDPWRSPREYLGGLLAAQPKFPRFSVFIPGAATKCPSVKMWIICFLESVPLKLFS